MELVKFETSKITKTSIDSLVDELILMVRDGHINAVEAAIRLKTNEELIKSAKKKLEDDILDEANKFDKGDRNYQGIEFNVVNGKAKWDFSGDAEWSELKAKLKAREEYLKNKPEFDPETGEVTPAKKTYGKDYITIKIPK